ncbi:integrator complex subunit 7-like [Mya arenaria]|uniref:integrator complex subunit 7-like n=1 Tax=Mya arenaria TaxID=6604 RepID=UPI0022E36E2A|nr:integrator complex subunit 7-like [Mya arenaria]
MAAPMSAFQHSSVRPFKQESSPFEQEQDANTALSDLDRGLRSMKVGVQCEAVVRFPKLFEKYPFPILINSAFLRLSDVFRSGNNFIRWCILRVTAESGKHLDKILNVEEFMRRIFAVYHSNDPVARAVTLRALGNISLIIAERKNIHHSIVVSLDSHDAVEVQAAIFAAQKFSEQSSVFAGNICDRISEMIHSVATPVDLKLSLIPILQYMHHDVAMATKARNVCMSLLLGYPAEKFKVTTLRTMSQLAVLSLTDIPAQIKLLLDELSSDPRGHVKVVCLQELCTLARKAPHLWNHVHTEKLCHYVLDEDSVPRARLAVTVLALLSRDLTFRLIFNKHDLDSTLMSVCNLSYGSEDPVLASSVVEFYTNIVIAYLATKNTEHWGGTSLVDGVATAIQTQILVHLIDPEHITQLKVCLKCAVQMVKSQPKTADMFVTCITSMLPDVSVHVAAVLCEALAAIGSVNQALLQKSVIPQLLSLLQSSTFEDTQPHQMQVYLCTVLFQVAEGSPIPGRAEEVMISCFQAADPWLGYKLARQAMRYGQSGVAHRLLQGLALQVSSEHFHFWLCGLREVCAGERKLQAREDNPITTIQGALSHYHRAIAAIKAAVVPSFSQQFQTEYISLRTSLLESHGQLLRTCNTFRTCPPPAIATAQAQTSGQEITKYEHIVTQLRRCCKEYEKISEGLASLYQQSFDADPATLTNIQQLQTSCELMKLALSSIAQTSQDGQALLADKMVLGVGEVTGDRFKQLLNTVHTELATLLHTEGTQVISYKHLEFLQQSAARLAMSACCFPRYFFQSLQQTALKLAISPQQTATEPILVQNDTFLTLKVEGVIQHGPRPGLYRGIHAIGITVNSSILTRTLSNSDVKGTESTVNHLEQNVEPHNDYFTVSFLLRFPVLGLHTLNIEAAILDGGGVTWHTGPRVTLQVKSYDDAIQRQQQTRQPQRPGFSKLIQP